MKAKTEKENPDKRRLIHSYIKQTFRDDKS